jgi:hypothetical protein
MNLAAANILMPIPFIEATAGIRAKVKFGFGHKPPSGEGTADERHA